MNGFFEQGLARQFLVVFHHHYALPRPYWWWKAPKRLLDRVA